MIFKYTPLFFVTALLLAFGCSKKEPENKPPSAVQLVFPQDNLLCLDNTVNFDWTNAIDPEEDTVNYTIIIAKDAALTDVVENRQVTLSQISVLLDKSTAYYWQVLANDVDNNLSTASAIQAFYTSGDGAENSAPFIAKVLAPENNIAVNAGNVTLSWQGVDPNATDTLIYEVFFGEAATLTKIEDAYTSTQLSVTVTSGKTYNWQINTIDSSGSKSIGNVTSFTVN